MQSPQSAVRNPRFILATLWLALFLAAFLGFQLPNNREFVRWQLWREIVLDFVPPLPHAAPAPHSGWEYFPQRFDLLAVAAAIAAGAWGAGHLLLRLVRPAVPTRSLDQTVFAFGLGFSALSLATLGCGLAGCLSRPILGSLLALAVVGELACRLLARKEPVAPLAAVSRAERRRKARLTMAVLAAAAPFVLVMLLGALLPSVDFDVNEYHFEGPKEFFQAGRISFLEHNVYTSFPFCTEMLTLLAMVLRGDWYRGALAGKGLLMLFEPLTALALYAAGRRWFGVAAGVLAALLYLSTPWIYRISIIAYAEGGLCFYLFATLLALLHTFGPERAETGTESNSPARKTFGQFLLMGLLAGSAMACKYPALVSVVVPLGFAAVWIALRRFGRSAWSAAAAFSLGLAIAIGPWLSKNAIETGNPVYPLAYRIFDGRDWDASLDAKWTKAHSPPTYALASLADLTIDIALRNDWVNPLLFAFAPLIVLAAPARRRAAWLWLYVAWLVLSCWLFTHRLDRFWVPVLPVAALLAGVGAAWWWQAARSRPLRYCVAATLAIVGLFNLAFMTTYLCGFNAYLLDLDMAGRLAAIKTVPEIVLLNERLPAGSKVFSVGDAQVFEARFPLVYNTVFDRSIFEDWFAAQSDAPVAAGLRDAEAIRRKLAAEGITHVYVCWREILRYRSPGNYGYSNFVTPARFDELRRLGILEAPWFVPDSIQKLDELDAAARHEIETWGRSLIRGSGNARGYVTFQVFPVARQIDPPRET